MKKSNETCKLECFMCRNCQPEWLPAIKASRQYLVYRKGETLFKENDPVQGMFFVDSGSVKVHKQWGDKELIIRIARQGEIAGHRGLGADLVYPVSATALEPVSVCFLDMAFFTATLKVNPGFLYELMMFFASELKESERRMRNLAHMPAKGRLAQAIINLNDKFGVNEEGQIAIGISKQDLASYAGTAYETIFRMLQDLTEEGLLKVDGKEITILQPGKLKELTTGDIQ